MEMSRSCKHRRIVSGEYCRVEQCSSGTVHVTLGNLTLHLTADAFVDAATVFRVAANRLTPGTTAATTATRLLC